MKPITTDRQHVRLLKRIDRWLDHDNLHGLNRQQTKRLAEMALLCATYESIRYPVAPLTPKQKQEMKAAYKRTQSRAK